MTTQWLKDAGEQKAKMTLPPNHVTNAHQNGLPCCFGCQHFTGSHRHCGKHHTLTRYDYACDDHTPRDAR